MQKIKLTSEQKTVLKWLYKKEPTEIIPEGMKEMIYAQTIKELVKLNMVNSVDCEERNIPIYASLTDYGVAYIEWNPRLNNPINWDAIKFLVDLIKSAFILTVIWTILRQIILA